MSFIERDTITYDNSHGATTVFTEIVHRDEQDRETIFIKVSQLGSDVYLSDRDINVLNSMGE